MHTNRIQNLTLNVKLAYTRDHFIAFKQSGVQCKECDAQYVMRMTDMHSVLSKNDRSVRNVRNFRTFPELPEKSPELPKNCRELPDNLAELQTKQVITHSKH